MRILITGSSGLIGSALLAAFRARGDEVKPLLRRPSPGDSKPFWLPEKDKIELGGEATFDAVIHLAGETVAQRWTAAVKKRIRDSRVRGTELLCKALANLAHPPRILLCASAIGFYGDRGDEILDEDSAPGRGFLADVCRAWEAATATATTAGIRVVHLRFGVVLSATGGALQKMLPVFRLGLGGRMGDGKQFRSWIALADAVAAIQLILENPAFFGPVNIVGPGPIRNIEFVQAMARMLHRRALVAVPRFAIKLAMGEMGEEALLSSIRATPRRLEQQGFQFQFRSLESALREALGVD
jgi:uncharacterized protein (TIGR01777 family)